MKLMTETQLLTKLEQAFDFGHVNAKGPQAVDLAHRETYEAHRRKVCLRILHTDTGGFDGKGQEVGDE